MADFDLTQTDQQVQNILNDAQGAMGAGAQTTLTTEYVMLKDTNGVYHKILKSSFTEAIRDVLAGLLVTNDKGTTINQIAVIASSDFGSITPANLASVLGERGNLYKKLNGNENFDDIVINGFYNYNIITNFSGKPGSLSNPSASFVLIVQQFDGITAHQILILTDAEGMYTRYKRSSGIWTNWVSH